MTQLDIRQSWRSDIQGLRALAVLFVIVGHLYPSYLPGGFIGVDIFFVISGYVITVQMRSLWATDEKHRLARFYARRIRRILPSAILVLFVTVLAAKFFLGPISQADASRDGFWASIFLANYHFAELSQDYFASGAPQSLLQHYWSLSIEEQFYFLWPLLFLTMLKFSTKESWMRAAVGLLLLSSLSFALVNLYALDNLNFFNSTARAWQLLAGCLLALIQMRVASWIKYFALAALLSVALLLEPTMHWPNLTSLLVIVSAAILCLPSEIQRFRILESAPLVYIGDLSYLLYLWHWPILMIAKNYFLDFGALHTLLVVVLSFLLAATSHYTFERPLRRSQLLVIRPQITVLSGIALVATSALLLRNL
jgi:peptidoglycan/LPS O-acetylase OafA/YrhL